MSRKAFNKQKKIAKNQVSVISLSNYEQPYVCENYGEEWVTYDKKENLSTNSYFDYIIDRYNGSTTNKTLVDRITDEVYGKGLKATDIEYDSEEWKAVLEALPEKDTYNLVKDFKLTGQACLQISWKGTGKDRKWVLASHMAVDKIAKNKRNEKGEIEYYWYSFDWCDKAKYPPKKYPAFGTSKEKIEILYFDTYEPGKNYYANPDYNPSLQSSETEEEISNFDLNTVQTGFSPNVMIQYNNGQPDDQVAHQIKSNIQREFVGSGGAKMIVGFNDTAEQAATITDIPVPNAHEQYNSLTDRTRDKILMSHKVVSPILYGIKDNTGFGNNADELETAFQLNRSTVIRPIQERLIRHLDVLFKANGWEYDLYFEPLVPIEFMTEEDTDEVDVVEEVEKTEETELSAEITLNEYDQMLWDYSESTPEGYELHSIEFDIENPSNFELLAATANSEQDTPLWKVRYAYSIGSSKTPEGDSRQFCNSMMSLSRQGRVYRKEDIDIMSAAGVNGEFAHSGGKYDIFLYGGGVNCYHRWERRIFKKKKKTNGEPMGGNAMQNTNPVSVSQARGQGFHPVKNDPDVAIAEIDKPNKGAYK